METAGVSQVVDLYSQLPAASLAGIMRGATPEVRAGIISNFEGEILPQEILSAAMAEPDSSVLWALANRCKLLPAEVLDWLIAHGSLREHRVLASHGGITEKQAARMLPGDGLVRKLLLAQPNLSSKLKREIVVGSTGNLLNNALRTQLADPRFAIWAASSPDPEVRVTAYRNVSYLPMAWKWRMARVASKSLTPFDQLLRLGNWGNVINQFFIAGKKLESDGLSRKEAGNRVFSALQDLGMPECSIEEEARMMLSADQAYILDDYQGTVNWNSISTLINSEKASPAAVKYLLGREDRPDEVGALVALKYGEWDGLLRECEESEIQNAIQLTIEDDPARRGLVKNLAEAGGSQLVLKYLEYLPVEDLTWMVKQGDINFSLRVSAEKALVWLQEHILDADDWEVFETIRRERPRWSIKTAILRVQSSREH